MLNTKEIQELIENRILNLNLEKNPKELYTPITYTLSAGGKRLRPLLTILAANIFKEDISEAILPAIGLEVFHNFTLLHDDIMDKADVRRNKPTVHKKWNENVAILSGDAMMIKSYDYFSDLNNNSFKEVFNVFNKTALEVCEGQQYDMNFEFLNNVSEIEYIEMIKLKTAVLLGACLKIGAIIGGADKQNSELLYNAGVSLGIAFQLTDDYLDCYGNTKEFGKKIGGDILANKKTLLYIKALSLANNEINKKLQHFFSGTLFDSETKIKNVLEIYNSLNIESEIYSEIEKYYSVTYSFLDKLTINKSRLSELLSLIDKLKFRKS